jgi:heme-degrading monooxygenase HmoA
MYARYTELEFPADRREDVLALWRDIAVPSASRQPGWRGSTILESQDQPGVLRLVTLWDAPEDFERYYTGEEHVGLSDAIKASGMRGKVRDGLTAHHAAIPKGPLYRVIRATVPPERTADVESFWKETGRPMMLRAADNISAEAFWAGEGQFTIVSEWRSKESAQAFLDGAEHKEFGRAMDGFGAHVTERIVGDRIA